MAGPQHSFPSGFPNAQQGAMRNQFGGAPQIGGLMSSAQQTGIYIFILNLGIIDD
jgi:mediator of RNA polymerase II transcription subunit 30